MLTPLFCEDFIFTFVIETRQTMRKLFRNISILVVASLAVLVAMQCVWVWRMYNDEVEDFTRRVQSATYKTIYKSFRMDAIPGFRPAEQVSINLDDFALWFEPNLLELDALQPYCVEVINRLSDDMVMMRRGEVESLENPFTFDTDIDDDGMFALRMHITIPYKKFWREMWALILSSLAMLIVMGGVLIYIVRTMFREKTLEEMRRDLTHNITHELKNPIAVASTANDALRNFSADADPERRGRYLDIVSDQLKQLQQMVEHILTVSVEENESHNPELIALRPLIEQVGKGLRSSKKSVEYVVVCDNELSLTADPFHLRNILATIVDNSIKYSGESVRVVVSALRTTSGVNISIEDNGNGIDSEHLKHVFDKFFRVPTGDVVNVRGYGLGLYYARRVAERHGGTIEAQSRTGRGTVITIKLPDNG